MSSPCGCAGQAETAYGFNCTMMIQSGTRGLGFILANVTVEVGGSGFNLTIGGGSNDPPMPRGRNAVYHFVCDTTVPESNGPDNTCVGEQFFFVAMFLFHDVPCSVLHFG